MGNYFSTLEEPERTGLIADVIGDSRFVFVSTLVILFDQLVTVLETNDIAEALNENILEGTSFNVFDQIILAWFVFEAVAKLYVHRLFFFIAGNWKMNLFDLLLVVHG